MKDTVCLRPQIAKANRGWRSYKQSVVKPVIIKLQQYKLYTLFRTAKPKTPYPVQCHVPEEPK